MQEIRDNMKILVSDFDGTLFTTEEQTRKNCMAIHQFQKEGNLFVIATGRNLDSLLRVTREYNIPYDYLICNDGTMIFDHNHNCLSTVYIPLECNQQIIRAIEEDDPYVIWYLDTGHGYTNDPNLPATKCIVKLQDREKAKKLLSKIETEIPEIHGYISENWLNLLPSVTNKSKGIKKLLDIVKKSTNLVDTIGDNANDEAMLKDYHGYVIEHSIISRQLDCPQVESVAKLIEELKEDD